MSFSPAALWPVTQLGTSVTTLYTAGANGKALIKRATFTNIDATTRTLTVYKVPSAGTAGATNAIISARPVSAGECYVATELTNMVLQAGESLQALSDVAGKINATGSGFTQ